MPRRRPSAKVKFNSKPRPVDRKESRIKRWDKLSDIQLDEEDQFHASRDKILLDEGDEVDEDEENEEEVFALRGLSDSEDEDDDDAVDYDEPDLDGDVGMDIDDEDSPPKPTKSKSKSKTDTKKSKKEKPASDSEEEETWGHSKGAYYSSNAAQLDSDDEEANELEENEALRLQAKARDAMGDEDFGLADIVDDEAEAADELDREPAKPPAKEVLRDKQSILRILEKESPETVALARDWDDTARNLMQTKARVESLKESESDTLELGLQHMYYQALLTYATTLAFYLHLRASEKYATRPELLREHPILKRLLALKEGLSTLENIGVGQDIEDDDEDEGGLGDSEEEEDAELLLDEDEPSDLWSFIKKKGIDPSELADLLEDAALNPASSPKSESKSAANANSPLVVRIPGRTKDKDVPQKETTEERPKKKRKTTPSTSSTEGTSPFDLVEPDYSHVARKKKTKNAAGVSAGAGLGVDVVQTHIDHIPSDLDPYGEVTALNHVDMSDKQAHKKSLRFHVARIASSAERRSQARANAVGGDDDIPYRERRKERETRLEREREKRKERGELGAGGDDLDDVDPEVVKEKKVGVKENGHKAKRKRTLDEDDVNDDGGGLDPAGYYDLVKQAAKSKKATKKAAYEAATARPDLDFEDVSGPRSITRAILKNKGLTPHRSKAVRNPRVKKRQKYEQAKKKVASQKAVYKGGIGDVSKYSGEQSGISKVVKSVRL